MKAAIVVAWVGIAVMAMLNVKTLIWNFKALSQFKTTAAYQNLMTSNAQSSLLAAPLATAMTINALFIVGLVFVPGLWSVIEWMFVPALLAFSSVAIWALTLTGRFLARVLGQAGAFDFKGHHSFAQMLPAFAFAMIAVGLSAPAAMSSQPQVVGASLFLSGVMGVLAWLYAVIAGGTAVVSMLQNGVSKEAAPTLMVVIPLMTVLAIMALRQQHGLHTTFEVHTNAGETMLMLARFLGIQLAFLALGAVVLSRLGYFKDYVFGQKTSAGSYALVCPGVALSVLLHFLINKGLVASHLVTKFGLVYWGLTVVALVLQFAMVALVVRLNRQHFGRSNDSASPVALAGAS